MHITKPSSGLYLENVWLWVADHDIEDPQLRQITIYAGRGLLDQVRYSEDGPLNVPRHSLTIILNTLLEPERRLLDGGHCGGAPRQVRVVRIIPG